MKGKLWVLLSLAWLGCGGMVDMGSVAGPAQGGAAGTGAASAGAGAGLGAGSSGSGPGLNESFTHELVQFAGFRYGMCALFSDERVLCWGPPGDGHAEPTTSEVAAREVPGLRGIAVAGDPFDGALGARICVAERSGKVTCRDQVVWGASGSTTFCGDPPEPCWFPGELTEIVGVESAVSIWMGGCQGLALRSDGLLQQWLDTSIPCGLGPPLPEPRTINGFQIVGLPTGFEEPITTIPGSGTFGFVTESGRPFHTRKRPSSPYLVPAEVNSTYNTGWPPSLVTGVDGALAITSSLVATAILRRSGKIWVFGEKRALGNGSMGGDLAEGEVSDIDDAVAIAAGFGMCAIRSDRSLWCWGPNLSGELGVIGPMVEDEDGHEDDEPHLPTLYSPAKVPGIEDVRAVGMTPSTTCVVRGANEVACWGWGWGRPEPYRVTFQ